ncbi:MAG: response regulator transcription factor [Rhodothermales bacterium]
MLEQTQVLLAEDDLNLGHILSEYLTMKGFNVSMYRDGVAAWKGFESASPDLCILDVMMPREDGFTLARRIRAVDSNVPIIFLTAKNLQQDRIEGFMIGGDDYLTKPFSMQELMLRMKAILRRQRDVLPEETPGGGLKIGQMAFYPTIRKINIEDEEISLTNKEAQLLHLLVRHMNKTLARSEALNQIWGDDSYYNARSMDVYIAKLRKILKRDDSVQILTIHGEGFKLVNLESV